MSLSIASETLVDENHPAAAETRKALRIRNARARKKLERRRDRQLLRSHLEDVWRSAGL